MALAKYPEDQETQSSTYSLINPPPVEYILNNQSGKDIRCLNYVYQLKTAGKKSASFVCSGSSCYSSISLNTHQIDGENKIVEPFVVSHLNLKHKENCLPKSEDFFKIKNFLFKVKEKIISNPLVPTKQLYEAERTDERASSLGLFPDFSSVKSSLHRQRNKTQPIKVSKMPIVVDHETFTADVEVFSIIDNKVN